MSNQNLAVLIVIYINFNLICSNPDVMLEAFFEHHFSPIFFVAYLAITFYFLMNVVSCSDIIIIITLHMNIKMAQYSNNIIIIFTLPLLYYCSLASSSCLWQFWRTGKEKIQEAFQAQTVIKLLWFWHMIILLALTQSCTR